AGHPNHRPRAGWFRTERSLSRGQTDRSVLNYRAWDSGFVSPVTSCVTMANMSETITRSQSETAAHVELTEGYAAHNYHPLRVVVAKGEGAWVTDVEGRRYLDCLAGY